MMVPVKSCIDKERHSSAKKYLRTINNQNKNKLNALSYLYYALILLLKSIAAPIAASIL
jgi:hypothetical protein